jgi:hypothetical protein
MLSHLATSYLSPHLTLGPGETQPRPELLQCVVRPVNMWRLATESSKDLKVLHGPYKIHHQDRSRTDLRAEPGELVTFCDRFNCRSRLSQ